MTIYIESFVIQNILINFCLLRLVQITVKPKTSFFRLILAAILGAAGSVIAAVFITNVAIMSIIKLICAFIMILSAFRQSKRQFVFSFILLFLFTYAIGGAITSLTGTTYTTNFGVVISSKINMYGVCLFAIALTYVYELVAKHIKLKLKTNNLIYPITLHLNGKKIKINAYLDTGNLLKYNNQPVVIVDLDSFLKLTQQNYIHYILNSAQKVNLGTVAGANQLKIFKIDQMDIKLSHRIQRFYGQYIAVNEQNSFKNTNYQALLTPALL